MHRYPVNGALLVAPAITPILAVLPLWAPDRISFAGPHATGFSPLPMLLQQAAVVTPYQYKGRSEFVACRTINPHAYPC